MAPSNAPKLTARMGFASICASLAVGCSQYSFENDAEFLKALSVAKPVVDRLEQMPADELGKLAYSKELREQWEEREEKVFAGTPYISARIRHDQPWGSSESHRLGTTAGSFVSVGRGRQAFDGYLGRGKARTEDYKGATYVYTMEDDWAELMIHIAAEEQQYDMR